VRSERFGIPRILASVWLSVMDTPNCQCKLVHAPFDLGTCESRYHRQALYRRAESEVKGLLFLKHHHRLINGQTVPCNCVLFNAFLPRVRGLSVCSAVENELEANFAV
jgi:hypothetical protein